MSDPFGEKSSPWWRVAWRVLFSSGGKPRAPKPFAAAAGALGPISGLLLHGVGGLDGPTRAAVFVGLTFIPPLVVERWWRERERRREEQLLVLPD